MKAMLRWLATAALLAATAAVGSGSFQGGDEDGRLSAIDDSRGAEAPGAPGRGDDDDDNDDSTPFAQGVYVAMEGDDANAGTPESPKLTITAGLDAAAAKNLPVFVAAGVYREALVVRGELRGGYHYPDWRRDIAANVTRIESFKPAVVIMAPSDPTEALVEGFTIRSLTWQDNKPVFVVLISAGPARLARNIVEHLAIPPRVIDVVCGVAALGAGPVAVEDNLIRGPWLIGGSIAAGLLVAESATQVTARRNQIAAGPIIGYFTPISAGVYVNAAQAEVLLAHNLIEGGASYGPVAAFSDGVEIVRGRVTLVGNALAGGPAAGRGDDAAISTGLHTDREAHAPLLVGNTLRAGAAEIAIGAEFQTGAVLVDNILEVETEADHRFALFTLATASEGYVLQHNALFCGARPCGLVAVYRESGTQAIADVGAVDRCEWGACLEAVGDISADPLLVSADDPHLWPSSPCIDAGTDPTAWFDGPEVFRDIDGEARPRGAGWDIGADEAR